MSELDHLDVLAAVRDPRGMAHLLSDHLLKQESNDSQADGHKCLGLTDQEAQDWPLESIRCTECGRETPTVCGFCADGLCEQIACIQAHAQKYTCAKYADYGGES